MITLIRMRIGVPITEEDEICTVCASVCDTNGIHGMNCLSDGCQIKRHNSTCNVVAGMLKRAGFKDILIEAKGMKLVPHTQNRPADVFVPNFDGDGRHVALDITVVNPLANHSIDSTLGNPIGAIELAEAAKLKKYEEIHPNVRIIVLGFSSLGGFNKGVDEVIQACVKRARLAANDTPRPALVTSLRARLAHTVMRHTARKILRRCTLYDIRDLEDCEEDGETVAQRVLVGEQPAFVG